MVLALTKDQRGKVATGAKSSRPSYFNAESGLDKQISADFEAVLILTDASSKQQAMTRLQEQTQATEDQQKRDALLIQALDQELDNAEATLQELTTELQQFEQFQTSFISNPSFKQVPEVGLLVRDLQLGVDETLLAKERTKHLAVVSGILRGRATTNGVSAELSKERDSWTGVLTAYLSGA